MTTSLRPELLKRYAAIARVLARHGGSELVRSSGLSDVLDDSLRGDAGDTGEEMASADDADEPDLADDLERLGPTFIKLGQLLATRADLLPEEQLTSLERLQDDVEPVPFADIRAVVERELGTDLDQAYASFDEEPLASASLGQVHRATLHDGRSVAVKVQRPDIRDTIAQDLEVLRTVASFLDEHTDAGERYHLTDIVEQFERSLIRELDYEREAVSLDQLRDNLDGFPRLTVPATVRDLTTARVLTMEHIDGHKVTELSDVKRLDVDATGLLDALFHAYLQQMLADGFVHADPHPGNVLLTEDGRLALLDVGMVVRLESSTRERLLRLLVAVADGEGEQTADVALELGQPTSYFDEERFRRDVAGLVGSYHDLPSHHTAVGGILNEMTRISGEDGVRPPPELTLLARTLMALDQVARELDPSFAVDEVIREHASKVMSRAMWRELSPSLMLQTLLQTKELVEGLPGRVNRILSSLADGSMRVRVDAVDAERLVSALNRIGNRLTAGVVLAALILGAALMARVETQATLMGYPALALVFFVVASVVGLWLVITILRDRG